MIDGSKGLTVICLTTENDDVTFDAVIRTTLTKWTERLEVWIKPSTQESDTFSMQYINCTATEKNGENTFDMYF